MDVIPEDDGLWDELSHQQSREIEQHRARTLQERIHHSFGPIVSAEHTGSNGNVQAVQRVARRAVDDIQRFTSNVYESTVGAYRESIKRKRHSYFTVSSSTNENTGYLDDFGISTARDDPLLSPDDYTSFDDGNQNVSTAQTDRGQGAQTSRRGSDFVVLPRLRRRPIADGWGAVPNLDLYFSSLYSFYYHRGLVPIIGKGVVELVTLFITLSLSIFLFAHVNWRKLATCIDETTCDSDFFESYYIGRPMSPGHSINFQNALKSKRVFEDWLGIPVHKLEGGAVDWDRDVVGKIRDLQESGQYRVAIHGEAQGLDALSIAHRILRKENFFVALFNQGLLDFSVPFLGHDHFCASLEWCLYFCVLNFMFNHKYNIRPAFYLDPSALKHRFVVCGIAHAIFMPFLLFFSTMHFGLRNAYDWKSMGQYLGPREWSLTAKWTFREFNELPHIFERRLAPSYEASEDYLKLFGQNELMTAAGHILVFLGGSIGAVLVVFYSINDAILLHVKIADWNLLWYAGVAGAIFSAGKSLLPKGNDARTRYIRNVYAARDAALANVANHTHHYPDIWRGRGWDPKTHKAFSSMFKFKAQLFLQEVLSLILSPYILCVSLPRCAEAICEFVLSIKSEVPGVGEVCGYATFNFDVYGDESWEGKTLGKQANASEVHAANYSNSVLSIGFEEASKRFPKPKAKLGKMEKSFFNFKGSHPSWKVSESGRHLVDRVEQYQREETAALTREQQLHIAAAARQLETLARLERQTTAEYQTSFPFFTASGDSMSPVRGENDPPSARQQAPADAGAGMFRSTTGYSSLPIGNPPPLAAFAQLSTTRSASDHDAVNNEGDESSVAPFALNVAQSYASESRVLADRPSPETQTTGFQPQPIDMVLQGRSIHLSGNCLALSNDIRCLLNMSSLETGSLLDEGVSSHVEERQYMWLDRYHSHIAAAHRELATPNLHQTTHIDEESSSDNIV
ncbi:hypothetical protein ACA910_001383 [Epithemia clementina (nom. ined.)]